MASSSTSCSRPRRPAPTAQDPVRRLRRTWIPGVVGNPVRAIALAASLAALPLPSQAVGWTCEPDFEVQCTAEYCAVTRDQGAIPIQLSFDTRGVFSLCAYSGCWEGRGKVASTAPFLVITRKAVDWSDPRRREEERADILIAFSPGDRVAMVKAGSIAMPLRCAVRPDR